MLARFVVLLPAVMAWQAIPAFGQEQDPREIQAQKDCLTGRADSGVALLAELFARTGNPNFIYNQARCYEQVARAEEAINRFREYLRLAKDIPADERADVERHLQECRVLQAKQEQEREKKAAAEAAAAAAAQPAWAAVPPAEPAVPAQAPVPPPGYAPVPILLPPPEALHPAAGPDLNAQPKAVESTPVYATWWFWTGLVVIAGGAVTAYLLATHHTTENACSGATIPCDAIK